MTCLHVNQKAHMACNFECLIKTEGLVKFTGSHVHCARGHIPETAQGSDVDTADHAEEVAYMVYYIYHF